MICHICGDDREECGCWELVEEYEAEEGLVTMIERDLRQETIQ